MLHKVKIKADKFGRLLVFIGDTKIHGIRSLQFSMEPDGTPILQLELAVSNAQLEIDGAKIECTTPAGNDTVYFSASKADLLRAVLEGGKLSEEANRFS